MLTGVVCRLRLKCNGTRAENKFRLSEKRTSPFKSAGGRQFSRLLAAEVWATAVVMLDTPCCEVVWRVLATHSIRQFPRHFPSRASPCAITFQLDSKTKCLSPASAATSDTQSCWQHKWFLPREGFTAPAPCCNLTQQLCTACLQLGCLRGSREKLTAP